jgi:CheY-like chemotaxis protein
MAQEDPPDVVLLDIGLPGMNGYELALRLRAEAKRGDPLIVAVTGSMEPGDLVRSKQAGIEKHLVKPVEFDAICDVLSRFHTPE